MKKYIRYAIAFLATGLLTAVVYIMVDNTSTIAQAAGFAATSMTGALTFATLDTILPGKE